MPIFPSNPFRLSRIYNSCSSSSTTPSITLSERIGNLYRRKLASHPFLLFGLPFISLMVLSSFLLTPATALRYERHDRKNNEVSPDEAIKLGVSGGDISGPGGEFGRTVGGGAPGVSYNPRRRIVTTGPNSERDEYYKLMAKDLDDWEQKRVKRFKGEPDGRL